MQDHINTLPIDKIPPTKQESELMTKFFENRGSFYNLCTEFKDIIILGIIYFIVGLPFLDGIIKSFFTSAQNSSYILLGIKTLIFMLLYFIFTNFWLSRK